MAKSKAETTTPVERIVDVRVDNENVIIGALAANVEQLRTFAPSLDPAIFQDDFNRAIVTAMKELIAIDAIPAPDTIAEVGRVPVETVLRLFKSYKALPDENVRVHIKRQADRAAKLACLPHIDSVLAVIDDDSKTPVDLADIFDDAGRTASAGVISDRVTGGPAMRRMYQADVEAQAAKKGLGFVPYGFPGLDDVLYQGAAPGTITTVASRPGVGKTVFSANLALRQVRLGRRVLALAIEPGWRAFSDIYVCAATGIPGRVMARDPDQLTDAQKKEVGGVLREAFDSDLLHIDDSPRSIPAVEAAIAKYEPDIVIVDMLTYILPPGWEPSTVAELLFRVRDLGKPKRGKHGHHTVALHHLRRPPKGAAKLQARRAPTLDELKNSGGWEEASDMVFLLHRQNYHDPSSGTADILQLEVAKQRRGPMHVRLGYTFDAAHNRIGEYTMDFTHATDLAAIREEEV